MQCLDFPETFQWNSVSLNLFWAELFGGKNLTFSVICLNCNGDIQNPSAWPIKTGLIYTVSIMIADDLGPFSLSYLE